MVLGTLFQYGIDKLPNIPDMIEEWENSAENVEELPEKPFSVCLRCTGNVKTLHLLLSIEDNQAVQVKSL